MDSKYTYLAAVLFTGAAVGLSVWQVGSADTDAGAALGREVSERTAEADAVRATLRISGMTCSSCATTARIALQRSAGVHRAAVSYESASAVVEYDAEQTSPARFITTLNQMTGYDAVVVDDAPGEGPS